MKVYQVQRSEPDVNDKGTQLQEVDLTRRHDWEQIYEREGLRVSLRVRQCMGARRVLQFVPQRRRTTIQEDMKVTTRRIIHATPQKNCTRAVQSFIALPATNEKASAVWGQDLCL
jgi:hypothetical protein